MRRMTFAMAASARFLRAVGASARTWAALRSLAADLAHGRFERAVFPHCLERRVHGLDPSCIVASYHVRRNRARWPRRAQACPQHSTAIRRTVMETGEPAGVQRVSPLDRTKEAAVGLPTNDMPNRLPHRFPVGATYVVEGYGGGEGDLRVIARYVVLPGGHRINVPADVPPICPTRRRARPSAHWRSDADRMPSNRRLKAAWRAGRSKKNAARRGTGSRAAVEQV